MLKFFDSGQETFEKFSELEQWCDRNGFKISYDDHGRIQIQTNLVHQEEDDNLYFYHEIFYTCGGV
jgi:hypothetical protein